MNVFNVKYGEDFLSILLDFIQTNVLNLGVSPLKTKIILPTKLVCRFLTEKLKNKNFNMFLPSIFHIIPSSEGSEYDEIRDKLLLLSILRQTGNGTNFNDDELFELATNLYHFFTGSAFNLEFLNNIVEKKDIEQNDFFQNIMVVYNKFHSALKNQGALSSFHLKNQHINKLITLTEDKNNFLFMSGLNLPQLQELNLFEKILQHNNGYIFFYGLEKIAQNENFVKDFLQRFKIRYSEIKSFGSDKSAKIELIEVQNKFQQVSCIPMIIKKILSQNADEKIAIIANDNETKKRVSFLLQEDKIFPIISKPETLNDLNYGIYILSTAKFLFMERSLLNMMEIFRSPHTKLDSVEFENLDLYIRNLPIIPENCNEILKFADSIPKSVYNTIVLLPVFEGEYFLHTLIDLHIDFLQKISSLDEFCYLELLRIKVLAERVLLKVKCKNYPVILKKLFALTNAQQSYKCCKNIRILSSSEANLLYFDTVIFTDFNDDLFPGVNKENFWITEDSLIEICRKDSEFSKNVLFREFVQHIFAKKCFILRNVLSAGKTTVKSRFLTEIENFTDVHENEYFKTLFNFLRKQTEYNPISRPSPCPDLNIRPKKLSVTEIEHLMRNPYFIYVKHILKLRSLRDLISSNYRNIQGTVIHYAIELLSTNYLHRIHEPVIVNEVITEIIEKFSLNGGSFALWRMKLNGLLCFVQENLCLAKTRAKNMFAEVYGSIKIPIGENQLFELTCCADRIDILKDGSALIVDYKTGSLPNKKDMLCGISPQLYLEAGIFANGGFNIENFSNTVSRLEFWYLNRKSSGQIVSIEQDITALEQLQNVLKNFQNANTPYFPYPNLDVISQYDPYLHLARLDEWRFNDL